MTLSEYLITKHGNGKAVPPDSGFIDNLYCEIRNIIFKLNMTRILIYILYILPPVSHYAEGTLMPILTQGLIFDNVSKKAPFWARPIIRSVLNPVKELLVNSEIKKNLAMVCISGLSLYLLLILMLILMSLFFFNKKC